MGNPYDPPTSAGEREPENPTAGTYATCFKCGRSNAKAVSFSWWGGVIGPKLLTHVKCQSCGATYNGKSGESNTTGIVIYTVVLSVIVLGVVFALSL